MNNTLILLTYDESKTYEKPDHIVSILLGGAVPEKLRGTTDSTFYTHYSILATLENNWDLENLGRYDAGANVFSLVADKTGYVNRADYVNHADIDISTVDLSISYPGFLNNDSGKQLPVPPPNLFLTGAGGKGVADEVKRYWGRETGSKTPYDGSGKPYDGDKMLPVYSPPVTPQV